MAMKWVTQTPLPSTAPAARTQRALTLSEDSHARETRLQAIIVERRQTATERTTKRTSWRTVRQ